MSEVGKSKEKLKNIDFMKGKTKICRICMLGCIKGFISLFTVCDGSGKIYDKIMDVCNIMITSDDGLPKWICYSCLVHLETSYQFKMQAEKSDKLLRQQLTMEDSPSEMNDVYIIDKDDLIKHNSGIINQTTFLQNILTTNNSSNATFSDPSISTHPLVESNDVEQSSDLVIPDDVNVETSNELNSIQITNVVSQAPIEEVEMTSSGDIDKETYNSSEIIDDPLHEPSCTCAESGTSTTKCASCFKIANKRKKYGQWTEENMKRALTVFKNGHVGINKVCQLYGIPKPTLKRRLDGKNSFAVDERKVFGRPHDLPSEIEKELVNHLLTLEKMFFVLTRHDLKKLAFQIAEENKLPHRFSIKSKTAGNKWYYSFLSRHPGLFLRTTEALSEARSSGFTRKRVDKFFDKISEIVDKYKFQAEVIFNMGETTLSTVQNHYKVLGAKRKRPVKGNAGGAGGITNHGIFCMSASGVYLPPMLVFKEQGFKPELKIGAPPGTAFALNEYGWINGDIFLLWLKHFVTHAQPSASKKVLLILDGHASYTKNLKAILYAKENGVIMLSLPAHTNHRLQPLVSFFKPLQTYFISASYKQIQATKIKITTPNISQLLSESFEKAATVATAIDGFKKCGIWPVDKNVFVETDFTSSSLLNPTSDLNMNIENN